MSGGPEMMERDGDEFPLKWHLAILGVVLLLVMAAYFGLQDIIQAR